jgi:hypothetical protein
MSKVEEIYKCLPSGWLSLDEAELLYSFAELTTGPILEVGGYLGRSTALLAHLGRLIYVVDSFENFAEWDMTGDEIEIKFRRNLMPYTNIVLFRQRIEEWDALPCDFAYLDGKHTYEGTVAQIDKALACKVSSIAVHDVNDKGGGQDVKRACLEKLGPWTERASRLATFKVPQ